MEEGVLIEFDSMLPDSLPDTTQEAQKKTMSDLRAQFFGLDPIGDESNTKVTGNDHDLFDVNFDPLQTSNNRLRVQDDIMSGDSDLSSDERGIEGTFSPGDSGVMMSSIPTSPDESDSGKIQLVSYKQDMLSQATGDNSTSFQFKEDTIMTETVIETKTQQNFNSIPDEEITSFSSITTYSSRPQTLQMKDTPGSPTVVSPSSENGHLSLSASGALTPQDMMALSPRSREIFEKARHFADMVQKPAFVAKRDNVSEEEFSPEMLQDFELERRAVISQSTVRRRDVKEMKSPTVDDYSFVDTVEPAAPVEVSSTTSSEVHSPAPTPERVSSPTPEARWNGTERSGKIKLYSENVVQEPDSSESVDRESIANLATTRRQWESIFSTDPLEESPRKAKKNTPKWEVRLPYTEKKVPDANTVTSVARDSEEEEEPQAKVSSAMSGPDAESAIEREIRLAMEREEMLKKEQEERVRLAAIQQQRDTFKPSSMQSSTESELQPSYHELTEADRGAEFLIHERAAQQEDAEQEESLQRANLLHNHQKYNGNVGKGTDNSEESIIEREIRLQREREAELAKQRGVRPSQHSHLPPATESHITALPQEVHLSEIQSPVQGEETGDTREIEYEEAISQYHHEGESRIAQELRELRQREEEMKRMREVMARSQVSGSAQQHQEKAASQQPVQSTPPPKQQAPPQPKVASTQRSEKTVSHHTPTPNHTAPSTPRGNVHASPQLDTNATPKTSTPPPKQETPIEREIRLARDRENELRRAKGLPELKPEPQKQDSVKAPEADMEYSGPPRRYYAPPQPDSSMRRFATNRLQQEIVVQRNREMVLRQEGKIITTSEEHIQPLKYNEVVGDKVDGPVKRSFKTPARHGSGAHDTVPEVDLNSTSHKPEQVTTPKGGTPGKKGQPSGASFSYREFKQTAESKIERELREMREREEELRQQRGGGESEVTAQ